MKNTLRYCLLLLAWPLISQPLMAEKMDSVAVDSVDSHFLSPAFQLKWLKLSALPLHPYWVQEEFGRSQLAVTRQNDNFITAQQAEQESGIHVFSEGIRKVNGFWLEGGFSYRKVFSDSVGWNLSRELSSNPYYLGNIKKGNWDKDYFDLFLKAVRPIANEKLLLGIGIDYQLQQHARYNDTRILINYYDLSWDVQLAYQIGQGQYIGLTAGLQNSDEKGGYRYYDDNNESFGAEEYIVYNLYGLGSFDLVRRSRYYQDFHSKRFGANYSIQKNQWRINDEFTYSSFISNYERRSSDGGELIIENIGDYKLKTYHNRFYAERSQSNWMHQLVLLTKVERGKDFNNIFLGANYFYNAFRQDLIYQLSSNPSRLSFTGKLGVEQVSKQDYNASHAYDYTNIEMCLMAEKGWDKADWVYKLNVGLGYRHNINAQIDVNAQYENIVSQSIVYPEWIYGSADYLMPMVKMKVEKYLKKVGFQGSIGYKTSIATQVRSMEASLYTPEGRRDHINLGITILH
ncbi:hypothetical protein IFO69_05040 [Echinicola sp. CAU 1574]|uniref:DUF6850 domain-containing protein n=1 Tax=Echinicola arenosa TaxID=2774144 RepID=A0ABR9AII6_9BACT|nr:DUF6850 family outer membrane beta-barrel protein [Echinicola arenosa]MBD8488106.1 hypothetical protein [Echinicola arenosa]